MNDAIPMLVIRAATQDDLAELARLFGIFEDRALPVERLGERVRVAQEIETPILALSGARLLGFVSLRIVARLSADEPQAEVTELYVEKEYQGEQVESALLVEAEALACARGAKELTLLTGLKNNAAQSLYRGLGYRDYALAMRKHLPANSAS